MFARFGIVRRTIALSATVSQLTLIGCSTPLRRPVKMGSPALSLHNR